MKSMFGDLADAIKALTATLKQEYVTQQQFKPVENIVMGAAKLFIGALVLGIIGAVFKLIFK